MSRTNKQKWWAYKNSLENFNTEAFEWYAHNCIYADRIIIEFKKRPEGGYVWLMDDQPILTFKDNFMCGMWYREKEKRYIGDILGYRKDMIDCACSEMRSKAIAMGGDRHFSLSIWVECMECEMANLLAQDYDIRPEVTDVSVEKKEDGSYFCTCRLNGYFCDTYYKNGKFNATTFEECVFDEDCDYLYDCELEFCNRYFHYAISAMSWKLKEVVEKEHGAA